MGRAKELYYHNGKLQGKYLNEQTCDILDTIRKVSDANAYVTDLRNIIYNLDDFSIDQILAQKSNENVELAQGELRAMQTSGVAFMYMSRRCLLGDSVGLGKTVQVAGFMNRVSQDMQEEARDHRYLALTENAIVPQFHRELIKFTGEYAELLQDAKARQTREFLEYYHEEGLPNIVGPSSLINQDIFIQYLKSLVDAGKEFPFNTLIIDESSVLGNKKTKFYENASFIRDHVENVIILNATPFESNLKIFYSQLDFVDPTLLPVQTNFNKRYCVMRQGNYTKFATPTGEYKNQHEFKGLVGYRYLARTRRDTGAVMEDCTSQLVLRELTSKQKSILKDTSMPHMAFDNPSYFDKELPFNVETSPKAGVLVDALTGKIRYEGNWDTSQTVLVYSQYKESQDNLKNLLSEYGITANIMNGDTPKDERRDLIQGFQDGEYRVLITNVMKGLNFGNCNYIVIFTTPGNVNNLVQFEGRSTREHDIRNKHLMLLCTEGPEKKRFDQVLRLRAEASNAFAGSDHSLIMSLLLTK